jgi:peptidoglycan/xylan/chitin deacetylase (PgdA/CDA1 family)
MEYIENFVFFDKIKEEFPDFQLIAFTISNFKNKENLAQNEAFKKWFDERKDWVEIAVHSYDHEYPPDGDREDEEVWIEKARDGLLPFLRKEYGYRSPGWQTTIKTVPTLKKLGFSYIAFENSIKYLQEQKIEQGVVNSHLYDIPSIKKIYEILQNNIRQRGRR